MQSSDQTAPIGMLWTGHILSALSGLLMLLDGVMKLVKPAFVVEATVKLGYTENVIFGLGVVLTASTLLYLIPWTSVLGAILLTGYLGGAVASHVRAGDPAFTVFFPVVFGILIWLGLLLRDRRIQQILPLRK
jgi:hypothetical protein